MNTTNIKVNWLAVKSRLKQRIAMLTDNDFLFIEGKNDELYARLQRKAGKTIKLEKKPIKLKNNDMNKL